MSERDVHILVVAGSRRESSLNAQLARLAAATIERNGGQADFVSICDFDSPSYDGDAEDADGIPAPAAAFRDRIEGTDALLLASPEYNGAMPGIVKNAIDWVSRFRPQPFHNKHAMLASASPSMVGGNRGLLSLRVPLEHLGAHVFPDMFSLAQAHEQLIDGQFVSPSLGERFEMTIVSFMDLVEAAKHYPCAKRRWVEFLGEHPNPATERVE
jgi:NAD(P)H-dependent FMN reductase